MLPKDLSVKLEKFKVTSHQVSGRILKMNKRLEKEFGERALWKCVVGIGRLPVLLKLLGRLQNRYWGYMLPK